MRDFNTIRATVLLLMIALFAYNVKLKEPTKPLLFNHSQEFNKNLISKYEVFDSKEYAKIFLRNGDVLKFKGKLIYSQSLKADYVFFKSGRAFLNKKRIKKWSEIYVSDKESDTSHISKGNYYHLLDKFALSWGQYRALPPRVIVKHVEKPVIKEVIKTVEVIKEVIKEVPIEPKKEESFFPWEETFVGSHILLFLLL